MTLRADPLRTRAPPPQQSMCRDFSRRKRHEKSFTGEGFESGWTSNASIRANVVVRSSGDAGRRDDQRDR
jgi:hypothetical protein